MTIEPTITGSSLALFSTACVGMSMYARAVFDSVVVATYSVAAVHTIRAADGEGQNRLPAVRGA